MHVSILGVSLQKMFARAVSVRSVSKFPIYISVIFNDECASICWIALLSVPLSFAILANEWRLTCMVRCLSMPASSAILPRSLFSMMFFVEMSLKSSLFVSTFIESYSISVTNVAYFFDMFSSGKI